MLCVDEAGELGAKIADLGTAVQLANPHGKVTDPTGTSGYAGKCFFCACYILRILCYIYWFCWCLLVFL